MPVCMGPGCTWSLALASTARLPWGWPGPRVCSRWATCHHTGMLACRHAGMPAQPSACQHMALQLAVGTVRPLCLGPQPLTLVLTKLLYLAPALCLPCKPGQVPLVLQVVKTWSAGDEGEEWLRALPSAAQQAARAMLAPGSKVPDAQKCACPCAQQGSLPWRS